MISALLLICMLGTDECRVDVSKTFFSTIQGCQVRSEELMKISNAPGSNTSFYIKGYKCVAWMEEPV